MRGITAACMCLDYLKGSSAISGTVDSAKAKDLTLICVCMFTIMYFSRCTAVRINSCETPSIFAVLFVFQGCSPKDASSLD